MNPLVELLEYLAQHDLPNWVTAFWSLILWPLAFWFWNDRKRSYLPGLDITVKERKTKPFKIDDKQCSGIQFNFVNKTGEILYLTDVEIVDYSSRFEIATEADRSIAESKYELKFRGSDERNYTLRQTILQTDEEAQTVLPVIIPSMDEFLRYRRSGLRVLWPFPRYFALEFIAMVGKRRRRVRIVY